MSTTVFLTPCYGFKLKILLAAMKTKNRTHFQSTHSHTNNYNEQKISKYKGKLELQRKNY